MNFIINRLKSIKYAYKGAYLLLKTEASIQTQFIVAILISIAGFYFEISTIEWILQTLSIALVMSIEGLNTAVEKIADFVHPNHHQKIGFIKDIAAGAVCIAAIAAIIIGCIIYIPKIF